MWLGSHKFHVLAEASGIGHCLCLFLELLLLWYGTYRETAHVCALGVADEWHQKRCTQSRDTSHVANILACGPISVAAKKLSWMSWNRLVGGRTRDAFRFLRLYG